MKIIEKAAKYWKKNKDFHQNMLKINKIKETTMILIKKHWISLQTMKNNEETEISDVDVQNLPGGPFKF